MQEQLSQQTFQSRQKFIGQKVLAYVDIKQDSPCIIIGLHEHYGLQNYLRLIIQYMTSNQYSIIIPSLFNAEADEEQKDDQTFLICLDHSKIAETVYGVCEYAAQSEKKVVLIGFSIGAAIGLKMLQFVNADLAFMFYGMPPLQTVKPQLIRAQTTIVLGSKDRINYLSEKSVSRQGRKLYESNGKIELIEVQNVQHGFMNPISSAYSEKYFEQLRTMVQQKIAKLLMKQRGSSEEKLKSYNQKISKAGEESSGERKQQQQGHQGEGEKKQDGCMLI